MLLRLFLLVLLCVLFKSPQCQGNIEYPPMQAEMVKEIVLPFMEKNQIPGVSIGIYSNGNIYFHNYGFANLATKKPITENTLFDLASVTKIFTGALLALEIEKGELALNQSVTDFIPELKEKKIPLQQVTLQDLVTHTSGLPRTLSAVKFSNEPVERSIFIKFLSHWTPIYPIGSTFHYSNIGFGLLGLTLEKVTGRPYFDLLKALVLTPLNMNHTFITVPANEVESYAQGYRKNGNPATPWVEHPWPASGALRSSSSDLIRFLSAILNPKTTSGNLASALKLSQEGFYQLSETRSLGLGWGRITKDGFTIISKNGCLPGFMSYIGVIPEKNIGVILLANKGIIPENSPGKQILLELTKTQLASPLTQSK